MPGGGDRNQVSRNHFPTTNARNRVRSKPQKRNPRSTRQRSPQSPARWGSARLGAESDTDAAERYLRLLPGVRDENESRLRLEAAAFVRAHWPEIERVASELLEHLTISGEEVEVIISVVRGEVYFPIQLVIVLSSLAERTTSDDSCFTGGEFLVVDQPERKQSDRRRIPAGLGDAVLFCTRSRLVKVGGVYGLRSVEHGMDRIQSGTRYALGIPFHEYE